jgi:hypothetical protein
MTKTIHLEQVQWSMLEDLARRSRPRLKPDQLLKKLVLEAYEQKR